MTPLLDHRLVFVTGKGGVGKTTVATGLAWLAAEIGKRTLVCEIEPKGDLADAYECGATPFSGRQVAERLTAMSMDTEASLREYLRINFRIPVVGRIGPVARAFDFVATAAPGVREILTIGKLVWEVRERHYDIVIVDASPTGHIVGQLDAPRAINELVRMGPVRTQTQWMLDILSDPQRTGAVIVSTPEEMPVNETIELAERVKAQTSVKLAAVVVNEVLPELFSTPDELVFEELSSGERRERLEVAAGAGTTAVLSAARLAVTVRRGRAAHLERLRGALDPAIPMLYLPYRFSRSQGMRAVHATSMALADELGF